MVFDDDEQNPEQDQHHGDGRRVVEMGFEEIVEGAADDRRRNCRDDDLEPHFQDVVVPADFADPIFGGADAADRPQPLPVQQHDRQNCAELNDDHVHRNKALRFVQIHKGLKEIQVARTGNRQPFGNPFHNAENNRFDNVEHTNSFLAYDELLRG